MESLDLVTGDGGIDDGRPGVDASGEGLDVLETLLAQPHGDVEGAGAVVADDDDGLVGIEFVVDARGDLAHGDEDGVGDTGGLVFPGFAYV